MGPIFTLMPSTARSYNCNIPDNYCVSRFEVTPVFLLINNFNPYQYE